MPDYKRSVRVRELLREEISKIVTHELKDPRIAMTTVTRVNLSDNLRSARVYVNIFGDKKKRNDTLEGLERACRFIRTEIGRRIELKYVPEIRFLYDDTIDYAQNIQSILNKINREENE